VAVLAGGGAFAAIAAASSGQAAPTGRGALFAQALGAPDLLAHTLDTQAGAQRHMAADTALSKHPAQANTPKPATSGAKAAPKSAAPHAKPSAKPSAGTGAKGAPGAGAKPTTRATPQGGAAEKGGAKAPGATSAPGSRTSAPAASAQGAGSTGSPAGGTGWTKPVGDAPIGTAGSMGSSGHGTGVDFLVPSGTAVHAVAAGTVVSAGRDGAYGDDVIVKHADGTYTLYGGLGQIQVSVGRTVAEGQRIGTSGATGGATGPHLHFEVRTTERYGSDIDPVAYLRSHGVDL
jgi:murein DD-endopeptidase MepM/ murein hydrolase activator NlpD